jgi:hypothetical protein
MPADEGVRAPDGIRPPEVIGPFIKKRASQSMKERPAMKLRLLGLASLVLACAPARTEDVSVGPWTVLYGPSGVREVTYEGKPLVGPLDVNLYVPDYKSAHFGLGGCEVRREQDGQAQRLVFTRDVPGKAKCVGTLEVAGNRLRWTAAMQMMAEGPLEVHVPIAAEAFESRWGDVFFAIDGREQEVACGRAWEPLYPREEVRLEAPDCDIVLRPGPEQGRWVFQDRRHEERRYARIIGLVRSTGEGVTEVAPSIDITIEPLTAEVARQRRLILGQQRVTTSDVLVKDAGFESGDLAEWTHGVNASIERDDPAEGQCCARLDVTQPQGQSVYITQQVPVTPGALYQVSCKLRTENVQRAEGMAMASVGAVLIHEWADPAGKWKYAGAYSAGTWGTSGWKTVSCTELLAPEGVGYAIIFLGLRATGTTWFDDVRMVEVKHHTVITAPLDGDSLRDNRPLFSWRPETVASEYGIVCRGEKGGFEASTKETSYRPAEPLPPGEYEWHVTAAGAEPSVTWRFAQTAPQDADTTGPEVAVHPQSFVNGRGELEVEAQDAAGVDWPKARLLIDGSEAKARVREQGGKALMRPENGWPKGGVRVEVAVPDKVGNETRAETWVVNTPVPPRPFTWTYDRGISDGKSCFLPLAMYQVPPAEMPKVKQAGFNTVHVYTWEGSKDDVGAREYLDAARSNGLLAFIGFDRGNSSGSGLVQMNLDHVARRIGALRDHPALLAWYLFDEPDLSHQYVSPANLRKLYQFIKALDPYHPVIVTFAQDNPLTVHPQSYDVHWTQVYGTTERVRSRILKHREMLGDRNLMAILHCYDREQSAEMKAGAKPDPAQFYLTRRKLEADIWMALALRSSGLAWWWYGDGGKQWLTVADLPEAWQGMTAALGEIHAVEPMLTAEGEELPVELRMDPEDARVVVRARRAGQRVLVIVASAEEERDVRFSAKIGELPARARATARFEGRELPLPDGVLEDTVGPLGWHVYLIAGQ